MRLEAVLEQHGTEVDARTAARRSLKLAARSNSATGGEQQVVIHNISRTGLLVEAPERTLAVGDSLFIDVPEDGAAGEQGRLGKWPVLRLRVSGGDLPRQR
jgi:hypothetical protein